MTELAPQPMRRAASLSEQPESTKAKARRRRSSSRSPLPFGLGIGVQAEKQSPYIMGFFLEEIYYILYTWLNKKVQKTDDEWRQQLTPLQFEVTRKEGTERAFTGEYFNLHDKGMYRCICCNNALFSSDTKFESGTGWPSFWAPIAKENVRSTNDNSLGMSRTAVSCKECDAHLGHVFDDGPKPTYLRYCMNSASLKFVKRA